MSKQWIVPVILILIIIVGIIGYSFYKKISTPHSPTGLSTLTASVTPTVVDYSVNKVFRTSKTQECIVQSGNETIEKYYINGQTVNAEFFSPTTGQTVHLLMDGSLAYVWIGSETKGSSMAASDIHSINTVMQNDGLPGFDITAKKSLQCIPWKADLSLLGAPYTVIFTPVGK